MNKPQAKGKIFYGWYLVAAASMLSAMSIGIIYNCYGLFVVPVCSDLGFPRQTMAMTQTILSLCGLGISLLAGKLFTRRWTMLLMRVSSIVMPLAYGLYSFMTDAWMVYPIALLVGVAYTMLTHLPISVIIGNWFEEKRSFALGIAMMGSGVGGMLFNLVTGFLLQSCGWRMTYRILALAILLVCVPCTFWIIRFSPEDKGLQPYGSKPAETGTGLPVHVEPEGKTFAEVSRTLPFWILCLTLMLTGFITTQQSQTMSPRLQDTGYSASVTSAVVSVSMALLAFGKVAVGRLFDKLGAFATVMMGNAAILVGLLGSLLSAWPPFVTGMVFGFGFGCAYSSMVAPAITQCLYGRRDYASIFGVVNALTSLGGILGPLVSAAIFDSTGNYDIAYYAAAVCLLGLSAAQVYIFRSHGTAKNKTPQL